MKYDDLKEKLDASIDYMKQATRDFSDVNEQVYYRKPVIEDGKMQFSDLVDNTLASYIEKLPKDIVQKIPTFTVDSKEDSKVWDLVYEGILYDYIIDPNAFSSFSLLQKFWETMRAGAIYGGALAYFLYSNVNGTATVEYRNVYWRDLYPEAYAGDGNSMNHVFIRGLYTHDDIVNMQENATDKKTKKALEAVLNYGKGAKDRDMPRSAIIQNLPSNLYELFLYIDRKQMILFSDNTGEIIEAEDNVLGELPTEMFYSDYDRISFFGRSLIDMAYPQQQALTSFLRSFIYTSDYNTSPAKLVKGMALNEETFDLEKNNTMFLGDSDGDMKLLTIDTDIYRNFNSIYSLLKACILTSLPASSDTSISAEVGDPTYSKTPAGVKDQEAKATIGNNYYRKAFEHFLSNTLNKMLNIFLRESAKAGVPFKLQFGTKYAKLIREEDPKMLDEDNTLVIDPKGIKNVRVNIEFNSTREIAKEEDMKRLQTFISGLFELGKSNAQIGEALKYVLPVLIQELAKNSNLENSDKIAELLKQGLEAVNAQAEQQQEQQAQEQQQALPQQLQANVGGEY
jgi:hypothetical protein|nr:MAG TPA: portal [Caudoviricetes sp.]